MINGTAKTQSTKPLNISTVQELMSAETFAAFETAEDFRKSSPRKLTKANTMMVPVPGPISPL